MSQVGHEIIRILEAPLTDEQPLGFPPDQFLRVEGGIPGLEEDVSEHDVADVQQIGGFVLMAVRGQW